MNTNKNKDKQFFSCSCNTEKKHCKHITATLLKLWYDQVDHGATIEQTCTEYKKMSEMLKFMTV